jgi:hypothetical protein
MHAKASLIFRAPLNLSALAVTHLKAVSGHAAWGRDRRYPGALLFGVIAIRDAGIAIWRRPAAGHDG